MGKPYNRSKWSANNPKLEQQIFRLLETKDMGFEELHDNLRWGRQTLNLYLQALEKKGYIRRRKKGRRVSNSLVRNNRHVVDALGWNFIPLDVRIRRRIELDKLDENQFVENWLDSLKFSFLNIMQDFVSIGKGAKTAEGFLEAHIQDLVDAATFHGRKLVERLKLGTLKPDKIWEIRNKLLEEIKDKT